METSCFDKATELSKRDVTIAALTERVERLAQQLNLQTSMNDSLKSDKAQLEAELRDLRPRHVSLQESCEKLNQLLRLRDEKLSKKQVRTFTA